MTDALSHALVIRSMEEYSVPEGCKRIVFTNGCFDILHKGHLAYLTESRKLGDMLIIGLNTDDSVKKLKGPNRPVNSWEDRAYLLSGFRCVDMIIGFAEDTPMRLIKHLRPEIITKGGDYEQKSMIGASFVESYGGKVVVLPYHKGYSSSTVVDGLKIISKK